MRLWVLRKTPPKMVICFFFKNPHLNVLDKPWWSRIQPLELQCRLSYWNSTGKETEVWRVWGICGGAEHTPRQPEGSGSSSAPHTEHKGVLFGEVILGCSLAHPVVLALGCRGAWGGPQGDTPSLQKAGQNTDELP